MQKPERNILCLFAAIVVFSNLLVFDSLAQSYPVKPIRMLVGYSPGGTTDITARLVAQKLSEQVGQSVIVDNRPGASGRIATERVSASPPDGYTLLMMPAGDAVQPALHAKLPYDLERGFSPISLVALGPYVLVAHPSVPSRNVKELIALAQLQPGKIHYGSTGAGNPAHLMGELFNIMAKVKLAHVPYKGASQATIATASGHIDLSFPGISGALPLLEAGKLKALAVTSAKRVSIMPLLPTLDESGLPGYDRSGWYGVLAPAGVSRDIIAQLNTAISKLVNTSEMKAHLIKLGLEPQTNTPEQFATFIHREIAQNIKLIKLIGFKVE